MGKASFIGKCLKVQEAFVFAAPSEVLGAVKLYCVDLSGTMLARLDSDSATKPMNCWGVTVQDVWGILRATHRVLPMSLLSEPSPEVAVVARSSTASNIRLIRNTTGLDPSLATPGLVRDRLRDTKCVMSEPEEEIALELGRVLEERDRLQLAGLDITFITDYINDLAVD